MGTPFGTTPSEPDAFFSLTSHKQQIDQNQDIEDQEHRAMYRIVEIEAGLRSLVSSAGFPRSYRSADRQTAGGSDKVGRAERSF